MNYDRHIRQVGTAGIRSEERRRFPLSKQGYVNNGEQLVIVLPFDKTWRKLGDGWWWSALVVSISLVFCWSNRSGTKGIG